MTEETPVFHETTDRQDQILTYLRKFPGATVREVGDAVGLRSPDSAFYQLGRLEEKGLLRREECPVCTSPVWIVKDVKEEPVA